MRQVYVNKQSKKKYIIWECKDLHYFPPGFNVKWVDWREWYVWLNTDWVRVYNNDWIIINKFDQPIAILNFNQHSEYRPYDPLEDTPVENTPPT